MRSVPLATAVVNGDSSGRNVRTYGSSDVSVNRNVSSASYSSVIETRPVPLTIRRGEAASISMPSVLSRIVRRAVTSPMPSSLMNRSETLIRTLYCGDSNRPLPAAVKSSCPVSGVCGKVIAYTDSTGTRRPEKLNE